MIWLKRFVVSAGLCVALLLTVLVLSLVMVVESQTVREKLLLHVVEVVNQYTELNVNVEGLDSPSLGQISVATLRIDSGVTPRFLVEQTVLVWRPRMLLERRIDVERLSVVSLAVLDFSDGEIVPPEAAVDAVKNLNEAASDHGYSAFLPLWLRGIVVKRLAIDAIKLPAGAANDFSDWSSQYHLEGNLALLPSLPLALNLNVKDQSDRAVVAVASLSKNLQEAQVQGFMREPAGGRLGRYVGLPKEQSLDAHFSVQVQREQDQFSLRQIAVSAPYRSHDIKLSGSVSVDLKSQRLSFDDLNLVLDGQLQTLSGEILDQHLALELNIKALSLPLVQSLVQEFYPSWRDLLLQGQVDGLFNISGAIDSPRVTGKLLAKGFYQRQPFTFSVSGLADLQQVQIDQASATFNNITATLIGQLDLVGENSDVNFSLQNFTTKDLSLFEMFLPVASIPADARFNIEQATGRLTGSIDNPNGRLKVLGGAGYRDTVSHWRGEFSKQADTLTIKQLEVMEGESVSTLSGQLNLVSKQADLAVDINAFSLSLLSVFGVPLPRDLDAQLWAQTTLRGQVILPQGLAGARLSGKASVLGRYYDIPFNVVMQGASDGKRYQLDELTVIASEETVLSAHGVIDTAGDSDVRLSLDRLPQKLLSALGFQVQAGDLKAALHLHGNRQAPQLDGHINYITQVSGIDSDDNAMMVPLSFDNDLATNSKGLFSLQTVAQKNGQAVGNFSAVLPLPVYVDFAFDRLAGIERDTVPLDVRVKGDMSLVFFDFLADSDIHRRSGQLLMNLDFSENLTHPKVGGSINLRDGEYENTLLGTQINNLQCQIKATQAVLALGDCSARDDGTGIYTVTGDLLLPSYDNNGSVDLSLIVEEVNLMRSEQLEGQASGVVSVNGDFKEISLTGDLEVSPLLAIIHAGGGNDIPSIEVIDAEAVARAEEAATSSASAKVKPKFTLPEVLVDLTITASQRAYLRGLGLDAELQGEVNVKGNAKVLVYSGKLNTMRGRFEVFGKKFILERGDINIANSLLMLDVTGVYTRGDIEVRATISGPSDKLKLRLSANPNMPEDEILAFVVFGKRINEISALEALQLAVALQSLRGTGPSFFNPIVAVRDLIGADRLSIGSEQVDAGGQGVTVGVGKYLNDNVYFELERTPDPSQPWRGRVEVELKPNLILETSTSGSEGVNGAKLKWKRDY